MFYVKCENRRHCRAYKNWGRWCLTWIQKWRRSLTSAAARNRTSRNLASRFSGFHRVSAALIVYLS